MLRLFPRQVHAAAQSEAAKTLGIGLSKQLQQLADG
jgi:hypothetical protein